MLYPFVCVASLHCFNNVHELIISPFFNASVLILQLSGSIPPEIGKLTGLTSLNLSYNQVRRIGGWQDGDRRG